MCSSFHKHILSTYAQWANVCHVSIISENDEYAMNICEVCYIAKQKHPKNANINLSNMWMEFKNTLLRIFVHFDVWYVTALLWERWALMVKSQIDLPH